MPVYVAIGDSVAAGVGLPTDLDASACARTAESYPVLLAKQLNMKLEDFACSGASIARGLRGPQTVNGADLEPQITRLYALNKPSLVTITIGANDVEWIQTILKCYSTKCGSSADTASLAAKQVAMKAELSSVVEDIKQHYVGNPPRLLFTGYYQLFSSSYRNCAELTNIDANEISWLRGQVEGLNGSIASLVSGYNFAKYVDINFTGHELCSSQPWIQDLKSPAAFHPNSDGQTDIARALAAN